MVAHFFIGTCILGVSIVIVLLGLLWLVGALSVCTHSSTFVALIVQALLAPLPRGRGCSADPPASSSSSIAPLHVVASERIGAPLDSLIAVVGLEGIQQSEVVITGWHAQGYAAGGLCDPNREFLILVLPVVYILLPNHFPDDVRLGAPVILRVLDGITLSVDNGGWAFLGILALPLDLLD